MKLVESDKRTFCNQVSETIQHIFWECEQVLRCFWNGFEIMLHDNCELVDLRFCKNSIIFGNHNFDKLLNELILIGKRYIFRIKMEKKIPILKAKIKFTLFILNISILVLILSKWNIAISFQHFSTHNS